MADLDLLRIGADSTKTQGVLRRGSTAFAVTLELPWNDNTPQTSCIPAGFYICRRVQSPKFGNTFEVSGVTGRSNILFHKGNAAADTLGCILVAEKFTGDKVGESAEGYNELMAMFKDTDSFTLRIVDVDVHLPV